MRLESVKVCDIQDSENIVDYEAFVWMNLKGSFIKRKIVFHLETLSNLWLWPLSE